MIKLTQQEQEEILKAIWNISSIYDFENTTEKEFKETYDISKKDLKVLSVVLSDKLRGLK